MPGGIKRRSILRLERAAKKQGVHSEAAQKLSEFKSVVPELHRPLPHEEPKRYARGPALTWANIRKLPEKEIATQMAMRTLRASVDFAFPRRVTYGTFRSQVLEPLLQSGPKGFNGRPVNKAWVLEITPQKFLAQAEQNVGHTKRRVDITTDVKTELGRFWTQPFKSGFRGLTRAEGLSRMNYLGRLEKKASAKK